MNGDQLCLDDLPTGPAACGMTATGFDGIPYPAGWSEDEVDEFEAAQEREREYREGR